MKFSVLGSHGRTVPSMAFLLCREMGGGLEVWHEVKGAEVSALHSRRYRQLIDGLFARILGKNALGEEATAPFYCENKM